MLHPYFSFDGRQKRSPYLARIVYLSIVLFAAIAWATYSYQNTNACIIVIVGMVLLHQASVVCLTVQRLHDMGHSGWFCWGLWAPGVVFMIKNPSIMTQLQKGTFSPDKTDFVLMASVALFVGGLIVSPGQPGDNKYEYYIKV